MLESPGTRKRKNTGKGLLALFGFGGLLLIGGAALAGGGGSAAAQPPPKNIDPKDPEPPPDPNPKPPPPPPPPGSLEFDLENNWGGTPPALRVELARIELAARIPGLARALAVKAWQTFRAGQPYVSTAEAQAVAAASPEYCRVCFNAGDGPSSKALLDLNITGPNKWPKPLDYAGWASGSFGLFDLLGGTAVYTGIHTDAPATSLPLVQMPSAKEAMKRYDVQGFAASYIVRRILLSTKYKVLKPGVNAPPEAQDSYQTWGNIFSAFAGAENYAKGNADSVEAKTRYLARAKEIGIDLAKVAYPWPPGTTYKAPTWTAGQVWTRLQDFKTREVHAVGGAGKDAAVVAPDFISTTGEPVHIVNLAGDAAAPLLFVLYEILNIVFDDDALTNEEQEGVFINHHSKEKIVAALGLTVPARIAFVGMNPAWDARFTGSSADGKNFWIPLAQTVTSFQEVLDLLGPVSTSFTVVGYKKFGAAAYAFAAAETWEPAWDEDTEELRSPPSVLLDNALVISGGMSNDVGRAPFGPAKTTRLIHVHGSPPNPYQLKKDWEEAELKWAKDSFYKFGEGPNGATGVKLAAGSQFITCMNATDSLLSLKPCIAAALNDLLGGA